METLQRFINPLLLHLQKFGLELKCPLCLNLFNRPSVLPCNHIFCNFCIPGSTRFGSECPTCKHQFVDREVRPAPYVENIVTIYRSLDATISTSLLQPTSLDPVRASDPCPVLTKTKGAIELQKQDCEESHERNITNRSSIVSLASNKRAYASVDACDEDLVDFNVKNHTMKSKFEEKLDLNGLNEMEVDMGEKLMPLLLPLQEGNEKYTVFGTDGNIMSQMEELLPVTPPSLGDTKETDGSHGAGSSNNSVEKSSTKRLLDINLDWARGDVNDKATSNCQTRDVKRHKNLNNGFSESDANCNGPTKKNNLLSENGTSSLGLEGEVQEPLSCGQSAVNSEVPNANAGVCAFCFTSGQSDGTGQMLHYANGKEVTGDAIKISNVTHVHEKCVNWSPQVYYRGDEIKNLDSELARAAKLKCSSCGKKGAAVGCFVKNCKKCYHLPCALDLVCRWEADDFLMLCPIHKSTRFPREKRSKSKKHANVENKPVLTQLMPGQPDLEADCPTAPKELVLCGSALSAEEKRILLKFASKYCATVTRCWNPTVTHVIAATDENGACTRTLKVLMATLNGKWILTMDWIKASVEAKQPVYEEPYEVKLDTHGCHGGPKTGRLKALQNSEKIFTGLKFLFVGKFLEAYKSDLMNLIRTAGGIVIKAEDRLDKYINDDPTKSPLIVYSDDPTQKNDEYGEESNSCNWLSEVRIMAAELDTWMITPSWILDSIAACDLKPLPLRPGEL